MRQLPVEKVTRSEVAGNRLNAALSLLAKQRGVNETQALAEFIFEEWQRKYPGMMFPDEHGNVMPMECTPALVKT